MYIMSYTINYGENDLRDFYTLHDTLGEARKAYDAELNKDREGMQTVHCGAVSKVVLATEPHWVE